MWDIPGKECMGSGSEQGSQVQVSGLQQNPKEKIYFHNFKIMNFILFVR